MKLFEVRIVLIQMLLLIGFTSFFSCDMKAQQLTSEINKVEAPKLLFLNYNITKDSSGKKVLSYMNKVIVDGRLKDLSNRQPLYGDGDIKCIQLDKNKVALELTYIKNPLKPIVEYVNDNGELEKRQLELESAQIPIKLQLNERTAYIQLLLIDAFGKASTELTITSIK